MQYVLTDGADNVVKYPYSLVLFKKEHPHVSLPAVKDPDLSDFNVFPVEYVYPTYDNTIEKLLRPTATEVTKQPDGSWIATWRKVPLTVEDKQRAIDSEFETKALGAKRSRGFTGQEAMFAGHVYNEIQRWKIDNTQPTPLIDAIQAVFPGQTKVQIATMVETKYKAFLVEGVTRLAEKIEKQNNL